MDAVTNVLSCIAQHAATIEHLAKHAVYHGILLDAPPDALKAAISDLGKPDLDASDLTISKLTDKLQLILNHATVINAVLAPFLAPQLNSTA